MPIPGTIYAFSRGNPPNPCRKYHISSDIDGASLVAEEVLSYLSEKRIFHKIVQHQAFLAKQTAGDQSGKFITVYMQSNVEHQNAVILEIGNRLASLQQKGFARPCRNPPKSRQHHHVFIEQPLDEKMFIYGGFICDPGV